MRGISLTEQTDDSTAPIWRPIATRASRAAIAVAFVALLAGRAEALTAQKKHRHGEAANRAQAEKPPSGPLMIIVSIGSQHVSLYADGAFVARGPVSTGMHGHPTPVGVPPPAAADEQLDEERQCSRRSPARPTAGPDSPGQVATRPDPPARP